MLSEIYRGRVSFKSRVRERSEEAPLDFICPDRLASIARRFRLLRSRYAADDALVKPVIRNSATKADSSGETVKPARADVALAHSRARNTSGSGPSQSRARVIKLTSFRLFVEYA